MPLCPQITNTPITVTQTADFTVSSVLPVVPATTTQVDAVATDAAAAVTTANAAAVTAGAAQSTANTALANAATAFTTAQNSLQPSAFAIQNPTTKQLSAIDATGLTVYVNSPTAGARVVLNSAGLAGFNSSGTATFSISASTGAAVFSGSVTGSTITGGTLNIAGNAIIDASGLLTATGATITGTINATAGYFGTSSNGFSINSTGLVGVGSGLISGGAISGTSITTNSGTIAGWILASGSFSNAAADTFLYSNPGTDGLAYSTVGRGIMRRLQLNGASGTTLGTNVLAVGGNVTIDGTTNSIGTITSNGSLNCDGAANFAVTAPSSGQFQILSSGLVRSLFTYNRQVTSARTLLINASGDFGNSTSTQRHKHEIESYRINTSNLLKLDVKKYKYIESIDPEQTFQHGFIAEEAEALGLNELIQFDSDGIPDYFAYEKLPIFLLQLAQEQEARIQALEGK
jgi:hypothetical protein